MAKHRTNDFEAISLTVDATLSDRVVEILTQKIKSGEFTANARLPSENAMAERFRVSRTVIREAISRLKSEGLVETRRGSGTIVLDPTNATAFKFDVSMQDSRSAVIRVLELRRGIEVEMAALAAARRSKAQLENIERALEEIDQAIREGRDGVMEDIAFHAAISEATGNPLYTSLVNFLTQFLQAAIRVTRKNEHRKDFTSQVQHEHRRIFEGIAAQDPVAARMAALEHMEKGVLRINAADASFWQSEDSAPAKELLGQDPGASLSSLRKK